MKTVHIFKAQPVTQKHTCGGKYPGVAEFRNCPACRPESTTIVIDRLIPELDTPTPPFTNVLDEARAVFQKEAAALADALQGALPGGTFDALLVEMMARKVTLFRVPHTPAKVPDDDFTAKRFRRVASLLDLSEAVPGDDKTLLGCAGTVLGMFAHEIEVLKGHKKLFDTQTPDPLIEVNPATGEVRKYHIGKDGVAHHPEGCQCRSCTTRGL